MTREDRTARNPWPLVEHEARCRPMDEAGALATHSNPIRTAAMPRMSKASSHDSQPLATDPPGDVERDLVGGAVEGRADRRRGAVGRERWR